LLRARGKRPKKAAKVSALPLSVVYQRYNGFMLGFMIGLLRFDFMKAQYRIHRARLHEVIGEIGVLWRLQKTYRAFRQDQKLLRHLAVEMKFSGQPLADFFTFGRLTIQVLIDPHSRSGRIAAQTLQEVADEHGLDRALLAERVRPGWAEGLDDHRLISELLGRAYDLAALCLAPLPKDERTCFVIMPFTEPFRSYYSRFYRRSLNLAGFVAIRAWEGVTNEHYLQMLFMLVHKCGAALADLSPSPGSSYPNLNVVHEVGLNMGAGNVTFLLRQVQDVDLPSNLIGLPHATYDPTASGWPERQAEEVSRQLAEITDTLSAAR
jgi:hypothetical protein